MSNLDNMLDNQQKQSVPSGKTWLKNYQTLTFG